MKRMTTVTTVILLATPFAFFWALGEPKTTIEIILGASLSGIVAVILLLFWFGDRHQKDESH